jgi:NAD(P)-dependent dehydrogenase (short-subunit alcohol dehydrogenase family)
MAAACSKAFSKRSAEGTASLPPALARVSPPDATESQDVTEDPKPPFPDQPQPMPGLTQRMEPVPDHGEESYRGSGRLAGKKALITGGDSGIGRAVAIAYAREGADVAISYLPEEEEDAQAVRVAIEEAGRKALLLPGDIADAEHCRSIVARTAEALGGLDILVNNAAHQDTFSAIEEISDEEWQKTFAVNIHAMFYLTKAAVAHMKEGCSVINTTSVQADNPSQELLAYASTKGAIQNFTGGLAQMLAERGIRANCVAPGPIWTPLIPATMPKDKVQSFGEQVPMKRPGQPRELAPVYVMLASDEASYVSGATIAVTGGKPII